jgi:hypothetical protein
MAEQFTKLDQMTTELQALPFGGKGDKTDYKEQLYATF